MDTSRVPILDNETFRRRIESYLGAPLRQSGLKRLLTTVNLYYAAHDKPFVNVSVPGQEVTDGVLRILVVEGSVEHVKVEGNRVIRCVSTPMPTTPARRTPAKSASASV